MSEYFNQKPWYYGNDPNQESVRVAFNSTEEANMILMERIRDSR